jgi:hypothetical protein
MRHSIPTPSTLKLCLLLVAASACAGKTPPEASVDDSGVRLGQSVPRRQRDVISREELAEPAVRAQSVLEVVKLLRPHFLTDRGPNSIPYAGTGGSDADKTRGALADPEAGKVHASIDNGKIVSVDELRGMHANGVIEIRYLNAAQAMQKFGGAAREGPVIVVRTIP